MKKEFFELKDLTIFLKNNNVSRVDKKIACGYFTENDGFQSESFILISEDDAVQQLASEMEYDTIEYFNTNFLMEYTDLNEKVIEAIKSLEWEGHDALVEIFKDRLEEMAQDAINQDGFGHFFNYYDGSHEEITVNNELCYLYFN